ncbi:Forkhead box d1 [Mycena indigotica]|uniref:Forkhead box d1 n=1 Tax=Mycena indigotica TaxID=2126181 RepID=A0A8H6T6X8_9AGAR|nr:Forkhead box d1 [Mycena indigotica]KAF7312030.1 Forkhead box d1 [Mycena indigotica]
MQRAWSNASVESRLQSVSLTDSPRLSAWSSSLPTSPEPELSFDDVINWPSDEPCQNPASFDAAAFVQHTARHIKYAEESHSLPMPDLFARLSLVAFQAPRAMHADDLTTLYRHLQVPKRLQGTVTAAARVLLRQGIDPLRLVVAEPERKNQVPQHIIEEECRHLHSANIYPDNTAYLRRRLKMPHDLELHPDLFMNVEGFPLWLLISLAIYFSTYQMLTLQGIIRAISQQFNLDRRDTKWHNTIRHTLSLYSIFRHVPRPFGGGKAGYWTVDFSEGEGYKRDRKRKTPAQPRKRARKGSKDADYVGPIHALPIIAPQPPVFDSVVKQEGQSPPSNGALSTHCWTHPKHSAKNAHESD